MSVLHGAFAWAPVALALTLSTAAPAEASTIYTYTGNPFTHVSLIGPTAPADSYTRSDRVTGQIELAAPLPANLTDPIFVGGLAFVSPLSFRFTDGVNTLTNANGMRTSFGFRTDSTGRIVSWLVSMSILVTPPFGSTYKSIGTFNYTTAFSESITDSGDDALCGPGSSVYGCNYSGDPFYAQQALLNNAPGMWERQVPPVPEPSSMVLIGAALAGFAARRRLR